MFYMSSEGSNLLHEVGTHSILTSQALYLSLPCRSIMSAKLFFKATDA